MLSRELHLNSNSVAEVFLLCLSYSFPGVYVHHQTGGRPGVRSAEEVFFQVGTVHQQTPYVVINYDLM